MLNFKLSLISPLFLNVQAYRLMRLSCLEQRLSFKESFNKIRALFPDMNELQFFEVDYEFSEMRSVQRQRERPKHLDYNRQESKLIRRILNSRNEESFSVPEKYIQVLGRGKRMEDLIGKQVSIRLGKIIKKDTDHD